MADYTQQTWVDETGSGTGTTFTKARMDTIEAGVKDAAEHHKKGTLAARPAAAAGNKNWFYTATDFGIVFLSDGTQWIATSAVPVVTALPTVTPWEGMEIDFVPDATRPSVKWRFRFTTSAQPYPWEFVGGSPLIKKTGGIGTAAESRNANVYADLASGPSMPVPIKGDYLVRWSFMARNSAVNNQSKAAPVATGLAAADANAGWVEAPNTNNFYPGVGVLEAAVISGTIKLQYAAGAGTSDFIGRALEILPQRVGTGILP